MDVRSFRRDADTRRGRGHGAWRRRHHLHGRWGSGGVRSAKAARALAAVEALHESMTAWLAKLPLAERERLDFRIGLHFGPVILSRLGSPTQQQITPPGDTVNVANRLLEVAKQEHCRIVVAEDLFQAASATAPMANIDPGLSAPLPVSF